MIGRRYPNDGGTVPAMVALSILRELDLLLGLAIGEATAALGMEAGPRARPARARLATLGAACAISSGEFAALRLLDARRRGLTRRTRAASTGMPPGERAVATAVLAAAGRLHADLAIRLGEDTAADGSRAVDPRPIRFAYAASAAVTGGRRRRTTWIGGRGGSLVAREGETTMPTEQPNNAPDPDRDAGGPRPDDRESAAVVLSDTAMDDAAGGGGLMGAGAGDADAGAAMGKAGAATPNSPIDAGLPHGGGDRLVAEEARTRALGDEPSDR